MRPTPSYLLLMHAQLGHVPSDDDGEAGELFIIRKLRVGLTAEADDPSLAAVPRCNPCAVELALRATIPPCRLKFQDYFWRFMSGLE